MAGREALQQIMVDINKKLKKPVAFMATDMPEMFRIKTLVPAIDWCTTGGLPTNRIIELYGVESGCKTYTAMLAMREFQNTDWATHTQGAIQKVLTYKTKRVKIDDESSYNMYIPDKIESTVKNPLMKNVVLIDFEGTYDPDWGSQLGIDNNRIIRVTPDTSEQGIDIADAFIRDENTCLVVIDSMAIAKPKADIDASMEDQNMAAHARMWNRAFAKFQNALNGNPSKDITVIVINRAYQKVGFVLGDGEVVAGGSGIKFAKSMSLKFTPLKEIKAEVAGVKDVVIGRNVKVANKKNKTGKPFRTAEFFLCLEDDDEAGLKYGDTDVANDLTEMGLVHGAIIRSGQFYKFGRLNIKGRENFVAELRRKPNFINLIKAKLGI